MGKVNLIVVLIKLYIAGKVEKVIAPDGTSLRARCAFCGFYAATRRRASGSDWVGHLIWPIHPSFTVIGLGGLTYSEFDDDTELLAIADTLVSLGAPPTYRPPPLPVQPPQWANSASTPAGIGQQPDSTHLPTSPDDWLSSVQTLSSYTSIIVFVSQFTWWLAVADLILWVTWVSIEKLVNKSIAF